MPRAHPAALLFPHAVLQLKLELQGNAILAEVGGQTKAISNLASHECAEGLREGRRPHRKAW